MKKTPSLLDIPDETIVNLSHETEGWEDDIDLILALVDLIWMGQEGDTIPS